VRAFNDFQRLPLPPKGGAENPEFIFLIFASGTPHSPFRGTRGEAAFFKNQKNIHVFQQQSSSTPRLNFCFD
jgi:hypothetical protein